MNKFSSNSLREFYLVPLFWALLLPIFIGFIEPKIFRYCREIFSFLILGLPIIVIFQTIVDFHLHNKSIISSLLRKISIAPGFIHKSNLDIPNIPVVTIGLVIINSLIFFLWPESLPDQYTFFPYGESTWFQVFLSFFVSAFLHADFWHLTGNMAFLLVFGSVLESRLGWKRLLQAIIYFVEFLYYGKASPMPRSDY